MEQTPDRLIDDQGHEWPVTGYWCRACGMPLHPTLRDTGAHLNCKIPPLGSTNVLTQPGHVPAPAEEP